MYKSRSVFVLAAAVVLTAVASVLLLSTATPPALAGGGDGDRCIPRVLAVNEVQYGMTYADWSAAWWQWAYSLPASENPWFDETGCANGANGQSGPVWFLTGVISTSGTAVRDCTVPHGKALFFPILNFENDNFCPPVDPPFTIAQLRQVIAGLMDTATNLACEVDGRPIPNLGSFRVQSPAFDITFPEGSVFQEWCGVLPGTYGPFVSDGYWLMLAPLPTGQHTIHFHGVIPGIFTLDITYHLTVTD
jgi:hypothetical protein